MHFLKKHLVFVAIVCFVLPTIAQKNMTLESSGRVIGLGSPTFSDWESYNEYDFADIPTGIFQAESCALKVEINTRSIGIREKSNSDSLKNHSVSFNAPRILVGKPNVAYLQLKYAPNTIARYDASGKIKNNLSLQRFGLLGAVSTTDGYFQIGIKADGYYGKEMQNESDTVRLIMGFKTLKASISSRVHKLLGFGMEGGVTGKLDTLKNVDNENLQDRYFEGAIPILGWFVDFGSPDFPVQSNFSLTKSTSRFIYVYKFFDGDKGNRNPYLGDSLDWHFKTQVSFENKGVTYRPAFNIEYLRNNYQRYEPTEDNNTLDIGSKLNNQDWKIKNLGFGIGGSALILSYATVNFEYSHSKFDLTFNPNYPSILKNDTSRGYDRIMIGAEGNIEAIPALKFPSSIGLKARLSYENVRGSSVYNSFRSDEFSIATPIEVESQISSIRYSPEIGLGSDQRINVVNIGLGSSFFSNALKLDATYSIIAKKESATKFTGYAFALDLSYELRSSGK